MRMAWDHKIGGSNPSSPKFHRRLPELVYWAGLENQWGIFIPPSVRIGHLLPVKFKDIRHDRLFNL